MNLGPRICSVEFVIITSLVVISNVGMKRADCTQVSDLNYFISVCHYVIEKVVQVVLDE